jgi:hypothetical protein
LCILRKNCQRIPEWADLKIRVSDHPNKLVSAAYFGSFQKKAKDWHTALSRYPGLQIAGDTTNKITAVRDMSEGQDRKAIALIASKGQK